MTLKVPQCSVLPLLEEVSPTCHPVSPAWSSRRNQPFTHPADLEVSRCQAVGSVPVPVLFRTQEPKW
jgi:hypothetical protein